MKRYFFFDESRFGTHSKFGHACFKTGKRTRIKVNLGFKNFYLYTAIEPKTGEHFTLEMPYVNTDCMNIFLKAFKEKYPNDEIVFILDGAGWHRSKNLNIP